MVGATAAAQVKGEGRDRSLQWEQRSLPQGLQWEKRKGGKGEKRGQREKKGGKASEQGKNRGKGERGEREMREGKKERE